MKPSQVAAALRSIANKIDRSKRPSITLVRREIRRVAGEMQQQQGAPVTDYTMSAGAGDFYVVFTSPAGDVIYKLFAKNPQDIQYLKSNSNWEADPVWGGGMEFYDSVSAVQEFGVSDPSQIEQPEDPGSGPIEISFEQLKKFIDKQEDPWTGPGTPWTVP